MPTAALDQVQDNSTGTASLTDIQSAAPVPTGVASVSDIIPSNTASMDDIAAVTPRTPAPAQPAAPQPSVWDRVNRIFGDEYFGKAIGVASRAERAIDQPIERATKAASAGIDKAADWLMEPQRNAEEKLAVAGYPGLARTIAYGEAVEPVNLAREGMKIAAGTLIDPKNWPLILEGGGAVRPALKVASAGLFAVMQQLGAIDSLRNKDYARAALQEGFALLGLKGLPDNIKATIADRAGVHVDSPATVLEEKAPEVRVANTAATADHLTAQDTVEPNSSASVRSSPDIAELRAPTARLVNDGHVPVVARNEVLSQAIQNAINNSDELQKLGLDPSKIKSVGDAETMLQQAADHIKTNLDPRASSTITFDAQKQLASDLGMTVEDLLSRKSGQAFNAEHAIAARSLLDASGRNVVKVALESSDNTALADALAQHQSVMDAVRGVSAEAGRALGSFRVQPPETQISNALRELSPDALDEARTLLAKIDPSNPRQLNRWLEQVKPATTADKMFELYRNALLSGPATVIKKGVSEATMVALEATKKAVAGGLSKLQGGDEHFASESYWYAKGVVNAMSHAKAVLSGEFNLEDMPDFEKTGQRAIKGTVGDIVRFPSTVLSRQTNLMYVVNYFGELNSQAARVGLQEGLTGTELAARQEYLVANPSSAMTSAANDVALRNTFQSELGKFAKSAQSTIRKEPTGVLRYFIPFFKTPINLAKQTAAFSPYGLFKGLARGDVDAQAAGLVGSSLAAGIAYLAANGSITGGGPVTPAKRETLESTGWQAYSIKLGDRYVSYRRLEPVGLAFALVADAVHSMKAGDPEVVSQSKADTAVAHISRNLADVAFLPTLSNLAEAITNPGARAQAFIRNEVASIVPAIVKDVAQGIDPTVRKPASIPQAIEARVPVLTSRVPAAVDITGQPVKRPASSIGGANPFPISTAKNDPTTSELARLGISTPTPPAQVQLRGKPTQLSQSERQRVAQAEGQDYYQRAAKLIGQASWARKTDDQKRKVLTQLRKDIDSNRSVRVSRMRKDAREELARGSL
jgi:hypothetical protein